MIKIVNPIKSKRPWPPILFSHLFQRGLFSYWPLLFLHLDVLVQISLLFEKLLFVLAKDKVLSAYLVQLVHCSQYFFRTTQQFCSYFLCMLAFSYQVHSFSARLVFLTLTFTFVWEVGTCSQLHYLTRDLQQLGMLKQGVRIFRIVLYVCTYSYMLVIATQL